MRGTYCNVLRQRRSGGAFFTLLSLFSPSVARTAYYSMIACLYYNWCENRGHSPSSLVSKSSNAFCAACRFSESRWDSSSSAFRIVGVIIMGKAGQRACTWVLSYIVRAYACMNVYMSVYMHIIGMYKCMLHVCMYAA